MENRLKKQLAEIKKRAMWLRRRGEARTGEHPLEEVGEQIVGDVVDTGAVTRGADFDKMRTVRRSWPWRGRAQREMSTDPLAAFATGEPRPLASAAPGVERTLDGHSYYLIRPTGGEIDTDEPAEARAFARVTRWPDDTVVSVARGRRPWQNPAQHTMDIALDPTRVLFLDIETAGLSANTYLFLCGLMFLEHGRFVVEQPFARNYGEEAGVLRHVAEVMKHFDIVVTYNGATFDLPFIRTRMARHRVSPANPPGSVDLLHAARRVFRDVLPDRRLVTVERHLRGMERKDDIPSRLIPQAWHDFVRTGDARAMRNVLYHNRMDLFTMAVILNRLSERPV